MVPLRVRGRQREELSLVREGRLRQGLDDDLVGFFEEGAVAFLVLRRGAHRPAQRLRLPVLVTPPHPELQPSPAQHVQHGRLLRDPQRVVPGDDVGHLRQADPLRPRRDGRLGQQRIGVMLRPLRLEVVLGHEEVVEAQPVRQDPLADLVHRLTLGRGVAILQTLRADPDAVLRQEGLPVRCPVMEHAQFKHASIPSRLRGRRRTGVGVPVPPTPPVGSLRVGFGYSPSGKERQGDARPLELRVSSRPMGDGGVSTPRPPTAIRRVRDAAAPPPQTSGDSAPLLRRACCRSGREQCIPPRRTSP